LGGNATPNAPPSPADNNVVSAAQIFCNQVFQTPTLGVQFFSGIEGINVTGGLIAATGNQVQQVHMEDNLVGGASGNTISTAGAANRRRP
jgi:hypothetical protein